MDTNFEGNIHPLPSSPRHPIYERLEYHSHTAKAILRAWDKAKNVDIQKKYYEAGRSGLDIVDLTNEISILRSNCYYVAHDINELLLLASSEQPGSSYEQAYIRARDLWNRLSRASVGFSKLITELDGRIEHEKYRWFRMSAEEQEEFVELGLPLECGVIKFDTV
jgi:hypothetical protein